MKENSTKLYNKHHWLQVWDWDIKSANDFMGGCSFKISDILEQPKSGWFKLFDMISAELEEAEEVADEEEDLG